MNLKINNVPKFEERWIAYEKFVTECGGSSFSDEHCGGLFFSFPCTLRDWLLCSFGPETKSRIQSSLRGSWNQQI